MWRKDLFVQIHWKRLIFWPNGHGFIVISLAYAFRSPVEGVGQVYVETDIFES